MRRDIVAILKDLRAVTVLDGYYDCGKTFHTPIRYVEGSDLQKAWELGYKLCELQKELDCCSDGASGLEAGRIDEKITAIFDQIKYEGIK